MPEANSVRASAALGPYLAILLTPEIQLTLLPREPERELTLSGQVYRDVGYRDWSGFYDWLRNRRGSVLGVRYWPDDLRFPLGKIGALEYVVVPTHGSCAEIYFSTERRFDRRKSADQAFFYDKVFSSETGDYLIVFETSCLTAIDLQRFGPPLSTRP